MLFWIIAAVLTLCACLAVLVPFLRAPLSTSDTEHDLAVYKDQLAELDRDHKRGLIGAPEAEQARTEIARRILKLDADRKGARTIGSSKFARVMAMLAVLSVPATSWGVYAMTGSPENPSQPLEARLDANPDERSIDELVARAEAHLRASPDDGRGWEVLAPIYLRTGRAGEAVTAYENAIRLLGSNAEREGGRGEALVAAGGGVISNDAQAAFDKALAELPRDGRARFYLAMGLAQDGKMQAARDAWATMQNDLPADSPWQAAATEAVKQADATLNADNAAQRGPTEADVAAAQDMSDADRGAFIENMVASLDARLRENPRDAEGWQRLVRAYVVLNQPDAARDALARGMAALGNTTRDAAALQTFATSLNIEPGQSQ